MFLARLYESTGRVTALPLASALVSALALTKNIKYYVKVFKTIYFLNHQMDLLYNWYEYRCWSKILFGTIPTPANNLEVRGHRLRNFMLKFLHQSFKISKFLNPCMDLLYIWHNYRLVQNFIWHYSHPSL